MKLKSLILGLALCLGILSGCNDTLTLVGTSIQPESDRPIAYADTLYMTGKTVKTDSVYARTIYGSLGEIYDPMFGNLESDFMCQFYCPENFRFKYEPANGKIDSVRFKIYYSSWIGDSLTPMKVQLYEVTSSMNNNYYTNADPSLYCDKKISLGSQSYTAYDMTLSDSIRELDSYSPVITINMPTEIGQRFYDATQNTPEVFNSQEAFNEFFKGIYVTNTYGTGNIITIDGSSMYIYYNKVLEGSDGQDSLVVASEGFSVTSEVIQLNRFKNTDMQHLLVENDSVAYLKTPAGVYTELTIPIGALTEKLENKIISNMSFSLRAYPQDTWQYALTPPTTLLVLPRDSVDSFFVNNEIENNTTSFLSTYTESTRTYSFGNIANLVKTHLETSPNEDIHLAVIPVTQRTGTYTSGYYSYEYTLAIENYLTPSAVKLRIDKESMLLRLTSIEYQ
jgi:hypothetical protein